MDRSAALRRALAPLGPYLGDIVLIGGWVPWLYLQERAARTSLTIEADVLLPQRMPRAGRPGLAELLSAAGFESAAGGALWRGSVEAGEQIEFLTPNLGMARDEGRVRPVAEQPRLGAVSLESLWPLGDWIRTRAVPGAPPLDVRVPAIGVFSVHKAYIFSRRRKEPGHARAAKDLLYLTDLAGAGEDTLDDVATDLHAFVAGRRGRAYVESARNNLASLGEGRWNELFDAAVESKALRDAVARSEARILLHGYLRSFRELCNNVLHR